MQACYREYQEALQEKVSHQLTVLSISQERGLIIPLLHLNSMETVQLFLIKQLEAASLVF